MIQVWTGVYTVSHAEVSLISSCFFKQRYKENRWDPKQLIGSGGMPSSHSATVTALAVAIGLQDGFNCSLFATATIFASVVGYQFSIPTYVLLKRFYFLDLDRRKMIIYIVVAWMQFSVSGWTLFCCMWTYCAHICTDFLLVNSIFLTQVNSRFWDLTNSLFVTWQVMYDASGIRLHAGKQAAVCNNSMRGICNVGSVAFLYRYNLVIALYVLW